MTGELLESGERAQGYHCPRCGGPLVWLHDRRMDPLPGEATYGRATVEYRDTRRLTRADREEVAPGDGRGVSTRKVYVRRLELICPMCNTIMSRAQAGKGEPKPGAGQDRALPLGRGGEDA